MLRRVFVYVTVKNAYYTLQKKRKPSITCCNSGII